MTTVAHQHSSNPFSMPPGSRDGPRTVPVLNASMASAESPRGDPMDVTPPPTATMGPPMHSSPEMDQGMNNLHTSGNSNGGPPAPSAGAAAAAAHGPKIVQTAFIHKLYNMLEDHSIQNMISWSSSNDSFVMSPTNEFSKVLAQYFKHTNISSFVRQLNMYGFHKVSDVFHTGSPEHPMWEFKHGNGNFKKGDLAGLREIKRRASRHALIHRDSFSGHKPTVSQPGTPAEPMPDTTDVRLLNLEQSLYEMHTRITRTEDLYTSMSLKHQALSEGLVRCHQFSQSLSHLLQATLPDRENSLHRELSSLQTEIGRQVEAARAIESSHEALLSGRQPYFHNMTLDAPLSPRAMPQHQGHDLDSSQPPSYPSSRRPSAFDVPPLPGPSRPAAISRPPLPSHLAISPRRFGSIGGASGGNSNPPSAGYVPSRSPLPPSQPSQPHPLSTVSPPPAYLARRHTSADIRQHGWPNSDPNSQQSLIHSPIASAHSSSKWSSSPQRTPNLNPHTGPPMAPHPDQDVRAVLDSYQMGQPRRQPSTQYVGSGNSRPSPPLPPLTNTSDTTPSTSSMSADSAAAASTWSISGPLGPRFPRMDFSGGSGLGGVGGMGSAPATRRSSMASNVHSLLNPAETAERDGEDEGVMMGGGWGGLEERKRKRLA
ncbi:MAG: hypothetical protein Q9227_007074 [Pyrenula ochraceoflavens]